MGGFTILYCIGNKEAGTRNNSNKHAEVAYGSFFFNAEKKRRPLTAGKMGHISCSTDLDVAFCFCFF
jgi:hypothetical protein